MLVHCTLVLSCVHERIGLHVQQCSSLWLTCCVRLNAGQPTACIHVAGLRHMDIAAAWMNEAQTHTFGGKVVASVHRQQGLCVVSPGL